MALVGAQFVNAVSPNPVGSLQAFAGASAPTGWLLCDGTSYSTSVYPELFSVLGYTYGGSGANFSVPDLRGRVPLGAGTGAQNGGTGTGAISGGTSLTARTRGAFGGDERLQSHTHNVIEVGQNLGTLYYSGGSPLLGWNATFPTPLQNQVSSDHSRSGKGSGENMPPFLVTNYIIKAIPDAPRSGLAYGSTPPIVTALPANPQFGDVVTYIADATNGVAWNLQYDASGTYPWKFIGGSDLYQGNAGSGNTNVTANTWTTPTSASTLTLPLSGDYDITAMAEIGYASSGVYAMWYGYKVGSTAALDGDAANWSTTTQYSGGSVVKTTRKTGISASTVLTPQVKANGTITHYIANSRIIARPIRVSA